MLLPFPCVFPSQGRHPGAFEVRITSEFCTLLSVSVEALRPALAPSPQAEMMNVQVSNVITAEIRKVAILSVPRRQQSIYGCMEDVIYIHAVDNQGRVLEQSEGAGRVMVELDLHLISVGHGVLPPQLLWFWKNSGENSGSTSS